MIDLNKLFELSVESNKYYDETDLKYGNMPGLHITHSEYAEYLSYKDNLISDKKFSTGLKSFNSKDMYFCVSRELEDLSEDYIGLASVGFESSEKTEDEIISQILSEIEGTLKIEGVNSTRKEISEILSGKDTNSENSKIIINMYNAIRFIKEKPEFNRENLKKLYEKLSDGCLKQEDVLKEKYYRDDKVFIGSHEGCPYEKIDDCMNSLFDFINAEIGFPYEKLLKPFIAHYYILYIHPYFDYNGRTGRMVSAWLFHNEDFANAPYFISEAINDRKSRYYENIEKTRKSRNDMTYFLIYLLKTSVKYMIAYKNIGCIAEEAEKNGEKITPSQIHYIKKLLSHEDEWFNWKTFRDLCGTGTTKQGTLKTLNGLAERNLLVYKTNTKGEKVFSLNKDIIKYSVK